MVATVNWANVSCCNCSSRLSSTPRSGNSKWATSAGDWGVCLGARTAGPPLWELLLCGSRTRTGDKCTFSMCGWATPVKGVTYEVYRDGSLKLNPASRESMLTSKHYRPAAGGLLELFKFQKNKSQFHHQSNIKCYSAKIATKHNRLLRFILKLLLFEQALNVD